MVYAVLFINEVLHWILNLNCSQSACNFTNCHIVLQFGSEDFWICLEISSHRS